MAGDATGVGYAGATEAATIVFLTDVTGDVTAYRYVDTTETATFDFLTNTAGDATAVVIWGGSATTTVPE
jgi:hypothetical protein